MTVDGACRDKSEVVGCAGEVSSERGCAECVAGFFPKDRVCAPCNATHGNCAACTEDACAACVADHVLSGGACVHFANITHCTAADGARCTKCAFWHAPTARGDACATRAVWWVVALAVLAALAVAGGAGAGVAWLVHAALGARRRREVARTACVFAMARSNVAFVPTRHKGVLVSAATLAFEGPLPIDAESKALLCVGNGGAHTVKVQFVAKEGSDRFGVRAEPGVVTLPRGMACEFEVFVAPRCSCAIDDKVLLVVQERGAKESATVPVGVKAVTEVSTKLHYGDVACEAQVGEGSFGVVFKGTFRGNDVAVKKMKDVDASDEAMDEFLKEVAMLDKFRCDQIVHFYGACVIPNHVMMVTEYAPCGSLADCIKRRAEPDEHVKAKLMLDPAKGLEYLHANGILHRDIKPDNVLVFSLDEVLDVNGKLTDFGSSRNVNLLMTNMTFTKGVGTPVYMAPEVLDKEKYKKPADVFSFGVMLYECFAWGDAYPKATFKFPWQISSFVQAGKRLERPAEMREDVYRLVSSCWAQDPKDRIGLLLLV